MAMAPVKKKGGKMVSIRHDIPVTVEMAWELIFEAWVGWDMQTWG